MTADFTQQQGLSEQLESERLSLQATRPPTQLPGYKIEKFLGEGAFGQVWVGRDLNTGRMVAIKFYMHRGGVDWSLLAREVKHLVQLSADRHIVQVLDVGWQANPPYYVMEYLESGSLEGLLDTRGRLPIFQAIELFYGICVGLNHSHGKGVLHCDLKPANILLDEDYRPRLADFGQSRMTNDQTPALGTLFYMAPEQADLEAAPDVRWDVYALGAILYRMLTGSPPHRSNQLLKKIDTAGSLPRRLDQYRQAILRDGPPKDHRTLKGVDRALAEIIDGCLASEPDQRFANVQQVLEALERRQANKQRRPLVLLGIVGPLLLLLLTVVFTTRSILETQSTVASALRQRARESNRLAAMFAAKNFELQLRDYFQFVEDEAANNDLRSALNEALLDEGLQELRERIVSQTDAEEARAALISNPARKRLQTVLDDYLQLHNRSRASAGRIDLATVFVTDNTGTILAIAYDTKVSSNEDSTGRNFAYRAYFHGGDDDFDASTSVSQISPHRDTRLSPAFRSSATGIWKVAVSTPVYTQSPRLSDPIPDAIFVATTNLGGFDLMRPGTKERPGSKEQVDNDIATIPSAQKLPDAQKDERKKLNQVAMLVDARPGERQGTIIQHPMLNILAERKNTGNEGSSVTSDEEASAVDPKALNALIAGQDIDFQDPMGSVPGGEDFQGLWIAAVESVSLPQTRLPEAKQQQKQSDLSVLVQYRWTEVIAPVGELVNKLMWYGAAALLGILVVIFLLWYMVSHSSDETRLAGSEHIDYPKKRTGETETIPVR
jgi:eukaryotic-like serine/threonine-protein kinase